MSCDVEAVTVARRHGGQLSRAGFLACPRDWNSPPEPGHYQ